MEEGQPWRQFIIAGIASISILVNGYCLGWTSPVNMKLANVTESPLDEVVTTDQEAWIGSLLTIGAIFGPFLGGFAAANIGRKWGLLTCSIPIFIGGILIAIASNLAMIYAGRVIWGVAVGMAFTVSPMYCAEIATVDRRGALGSFLQVFVTLGFLLVYSVGPWVSYRVIVYVNMAVNAFFVLAFMFMPESPMYHITKGNKDGAIESLMKIRGRSREAVMSEIDTMEAEVTAAMEKNATIADVFRGGNFKAFYISCALVFFQQFCGINAMLFNMSTIFDAAGSDLDSSVSTIIVGAVQVVASAMTPFVVDRLGRRILMLISSCGTAISAGLLGMYFILADNENPAADSIGWLPIVALILFILTYCWGLGPLPWAILSELFPIEVKAVASPIVTAICWGLGFLVTRFFVPIAYAIGMGQTFLIFGAFCILSFFFTLFLVPETKGKSFQEIQIMLSGKSYKSEKF